MAASAIKQKVVVDRQAAVCDDYMRAIRAASGVTDTRNSKEMLT